MSCCILKNSGIHYESWSTGVLGPVVLHGLNEGSRDLTWNEWSYQVSLLHKHSCSFSFQMITFTF